MAKTKTKGDIGVAAIAAEILKRGYKIAYPFGEDWKYDLIVLKDDKLIRIQCKYTESNGEFIEVRCRSCNNWSIVKYTKSDFEYIAVYDKTTNKCYFIPSDYLKNGRSVMHLRITPPKNNQLGKVVYAYNFESL